MKIKSPSKSHAFKSLALAVAMAGLVSIQDVQGQSCSAVGVNFEAKSVTASKSKCTHFVELSSPSSPPKYYLKNVIQSNYSFIYSDDTGTISGSYNYSETDALDRMNSCAESDNSATSGDYNGTTYSCATSDGTTTGDCMADSEVISLYGVCDTDCQEPGQSYSSSDNWSQTTHTYTEQGSASFPGPPGSSCSIQLTTTENLVSEYTDSMLRSDMISLLPSYPTDWTICGNSCGLASYSLSSDHVTASGGKFKYRVHVFCSCGLKIKVEWDEVTYYTNGGQSIKHMKEKITGNGDPNGYYTSEHEVNVPDAEGTTDAENLHVTILSSASGDDPGNGS